MKEKDILQDVLIATKFLMGMYNQFGLECSNKPLRNLFNAHHTEVSKHNFEIFEAMKNKGLYPVTEAEKADVDKAVKMHTEMQKELDKIK